MNYNNACIFTVVLPHYNTVNMPSQHIPQPSEPPLVETRIEDGKLSYERRWYFSFISVAKNI